MEKFPEVTILIINFNSLNNTRECLNSVLKIKYPKFKVAVLDNGSHTNVTDELSTEFKKFEFIRSEKNLGFAGGNNLLIRKSTTPYVLLLNNDTTVEPDFLNELIKTSQLFPRAAIIQPKIRSYYQKNYFEYAGAAGGKIDSLGYPYARGRVGFYLEEDCGQYDNYESLHWASGACMLIRSKLFSEIGYLSEKFFFYHEETDLCWRARNYGYTILFSPKAVIYHKGSGSSNKMLAKKIFYVHRNNLMLLFKNVSFLKLIYVLPTRLLLDHISNIFYLLVGQPLYVISVLKAHFSFFAHIPALARERPAQKSKRYIVEKELFPLSIFFDYFILHKRRFSEIMGKTSNTKIIKYRELFPPNFFSKQNGNVRKIADKAMIMLVIVSIAFVGIWFKDRMNIASGEEGLAFVFPARALSIYSNAWYETGTGYPMPVTLPRVTLFGIAAALSMIVPSWLSQALIYIFLMTSALIGMYKLGAELKLNRLVSILAALFYLCNLYTLSQVLGRLISSGVTVWAYLPWFIFLSMRLLKNIEKKYILLFICFSIIFSNSFGYPSSVFLLWTPVAIFFFYKIFSEANKVKITKRLIILGVIWLITNSWWIYPYLKIGSNAFETISDPNTNINSLRGVSQYFPLKTILLLKQDYLFGKLMYRDFYQNVYITAISYLVLGLALLGTIIAVIKKKAIYIVILLLVGLFLSKGSNPPLGDYFFSKLFKYIPVTQSLRNTYEKLGLLVVLPYAFLFALGVNTVKQKLKSNVGWSAVSITLALTCGALVYPYWNGDVFGSGISNAKIKVPAYYSELNSYINRNAENSRILTIPILPGDGLNIPWGSHPYGGLEPSEFLYDKPSVSKILRTPYFDDKYLELQESFKTGKNFKENLEQMNVKYIVVNHDLDPKIYSITSINSAEEKLQQILETKPLKKFNKLHLYQVENENIALFQLQGKIIPEMKFVQVNKTRYRVSIKNAQSEYSLVFKETFNNLWKAKIANKSIKNHSLVFGYANKWEINQKGSYDIDVTFDLY